MTSPDTFSSAVGGIIQVAGPAAEIIHAQRRNSARCRWWARCGWARPDSRPEGSGQLRPKTRFRRYAPWAAGRRDRPRTVRGAPGRSRPPTRGGFQAVHHEDATVLLDGGRAISSRGSSELPFHFGRHHAPARRRSRPATPRKAGHARPVKQVRSQMDGVLFCVGDDHDFAGPGGHVDVAQAARIAQLCLAVAT